jgi:HlyD family secretion protein
MTLRKKLLIGGAVVLVLAAVVYANFRFTRVPGKPINTEVLKTRDLDATVSASGKIQAKRTVNISADTIGRITKLAVDEGDRVKQGQFLMQIDPRIQEAAFTRSRGALAEAESSLEQQRAAIISAREALSLARENQRRQRELWAQQLTTREALDTAENTVKLREADLRNQEQALTTQEHRIQQAKAGLTSAQTDLSKVRIESPLDGIVVRRNVEEGEMVVVGTMNTVGSQLLVVADMSVIDAEVEVDETDIPSVKLGQIAKITIDAMPGKTFTGKVTEIGNSPIQDTTTGAASTSTQQATNFKVKVTIDGEIPDVRPGFTCSAEITTATRKKVLTVPIQAMAVRELIYDKDGSIVRPPKDKKKATPGTGAFTASAEELPPGQTKKETEGVFLFQNGNATFVPVKTGIAGDKYFEVLSGLKAGDQVITGPFNSVRDLQDGDQVKIDTTAPKRTTS